MSPQQASFGHSLLLFAAQRVEVLRPPSGTLRRGWLALDASRSTTLLLATSVLVAVGVLVLALRRFARTRNKSS
ncbi:MAG: hypothetical protein Q8Q09_25135 [Deltaproteobacteria bacterium]|nr:hypothetical protein [Deltaproteobacteria bacterium]